MVGRPRKRGYRTPSGVLSRAKPEREEYTRDLDRYLYQPMAIYVTECGPLSKIGISKNPSQRAREIQTSNGQIVRMVWYRWMDGPNARATERAIHQQYKGKNCHANGEWYYWHTSDAIDVVSKKIEELGFYSIWERYSAFVERHWNDPTRERLINPASGASQWRS